MADSSSGASPATDLVTDLVARYGRQAVQVFAAFAGATGLFYAIGFVIVNVSLLRLGVYETALINIGYVAPGVAFAILFALSALATIGAFEAWRRVILKPADAQSRRFSWSSWRSIDFRNILVVLLSAATVILVSLALGWAMWFFRNVATGLVLWSLAVNLGVAVLAYAENLPVAHRMVAQQVDERGNRMSPWQARLKSPVFVLMAAVFIFFSVLFYGQFVYDQVPPVFGGGLPIVVRFFGPDVGQLSEIGIGLEPGERNLTERVKLITQTADRYIVRGADRAISFDKSFVRGIRYEPPDFFLDPQFVRLNRTNAGERLLADGLYDQALSEFNLVLNDSPDFAPALRGRARLATATLDFARAVQDYRRLTQAEPSRADDFYSLATSYVLRAESESSAIPIEDVAAALDSATAISPTLKERARADAVFDPLRPSATFDRMIYGSGSDGARWFRDRARLFAETGDDEEAIQTFQRAITYAIAYAAEEDALAPAEIARLHVDLSTAYLRRDPLSAEAVAQLQQAVGLPGLSAQEVAEANLALSEVYLKRDPLSSDAVAALQAAVAATGAQDPKYLNRLAELYRARNESDKALETYGIALRLGAAQDPNRRDTLIGQGRVALESRQYLLASAAFSQALTLLPGDPATLYDYARSLAALSDPGADAALRSAIERDSSLADRARGEDWQTYFANAGTAVTSLIDGAVAARKARALRDQGDVDGAISEYQRAAAADASVAAYWLELGGLLTQQRRYTEAIAAYQNGLTRTTSQPARLAALGALGDAQIAAGDFAAAVASYTEIINAVGGQATDVQYARLARAHELAEEYTLAAATYEQAAQRNPAEALYVYRSGLNWLLTGQTDRGLAALKPVIDQGGLRVESTDMLGLREAASTNASVRSTLALGTLLRIADNPEVSEGQVWWPVRTGDDLAGWVRASGVVPSSPPPVPPAPPATATPLAAVP